MWAQMQLKTLNESVCVVCDGPEFSNSEKKVSKLTSHFQQGYFNSSINFVKGRMASGRNNMPTDFDVEHENVALFTSSS